MQLNFPKIVLVAPINITHLLQLILEVEDTFSILFSTILASNPLYS